jgi:hypothetical protein
MDVERQVNHLRLSGSGGDSRQQRRIRDSRRSDVVVPDALLLPTSTQGKPDDGCMHVGIPGGL